MNPVNKSNNIIESLYFKELDRSYIPKYMSKNVFSRHLINHLNLDTELQGHDGCVNCLEWNQSGTMLASGSDDLKIILWDPFKRKTIKKIDTRHRSNIFSVKFLPFTGDSLIASGAADRDIFVYDVNRNLNINEIHSHQNRVKRLETSLDTPFLFWSCGEDGVVLQHDIRCQPSNITSLLLNYSSNELLNNKHSEVKCIAINQARSEYIAVGLSDPYARVYDRRMIELRSFKNRNTQISSTTTTSTSVNSLPKCVFEYCPLNENQPDIPLIYYVPGHLPKRIEEYQKRMKTLSVTFLSFSPDGSELLVNLGGEQLYLFDLNLSNKKLENKFKYDSYRELLSDIQTTDSIQPTTSSSSSSSSSIQSESSSTSSSLSASSTDQLEYSAKSSSNNNKKQKPKLPPKAEELKIKANSSFEEQNYLEAIEYYNLAIQIAPDSPILYGNRAASLMKRSWDGDIYAAMLDCYKALSLDKTHLKSHFRLAKCLNDLKWHREADECIKVFCKQFPDYAKSQACENLIKEIKNSIRLTDEKLKKDSKYKKSDIEDESDEDSNNKEDESSNVEWDIESDTSEDESSSQESSQSTTKKLKTTESTESIEKTKNVKKLIKEYQKRMTESIDFKLRYCGHCNVATDIKEANFFGENFIAAGSDDGSFFIWDKSSTNIVRVLKGDESIVNCIQPHPYSCFIATSGIDPHVRLWSPKFEDSKDYQDRVVSDVKSAALNNQIQMNSHPFEYLFLNLTQNTNWDTESEAGPGQQNIACRPS